MIIKIHKSPDGKKVVALCDSNLLGKVFEQDKVQLDLRSDFYKGEEKQEKEILQLLTKVAACSVRVFNHNGIRKAIISFVPTPSVEETSIGSLYFFGILTRPLKPPMPPATSLRLVVETIFLISFTNLFDLAISTPEFL